MAKRTYGEYCALARAFDVLGERWTPLLLRELALGPRRYADLLEGLPGVSPSLLTQPALVVRTDLETFAAIGGGALLLDDAADRLHVEGDAEAAQRCLRLWAPAALAAPA